MSTTIKNIHSELTSIASLLGIELDPGNDKKRLFESIESKLESLKKEGIISTPQSLAFPESDKPVSQDQWNKIEQARQALRTDHSIRREMLLKRLDCTIASFQWKSSDKKNQSLECYEQECRQGGLDIEPEVNMAHLLAVRETDCDRLLNSVISSGKRARQTHENSYGGDSQKTRDKDYLRDFIMPDVPDRGGRPDEVRPPTRETFSQQNHQRRGGGRGSRGGGHFRRNDRDGRDRDSNQHNQEQKSGHNSNFRGHRSGGRNQGRRH